MRARSTRRAALVLLIGVQLCVAVSALVRALHYRAGLEVLLGATFSATLAGLLVAIAANLVVLGRELRVAVGRGPRGMALREDDGTTAGLLRAAFASVVLGAASLAIVVEPYQVLYVHLFAGAWTALLALWLLVERSVAARLGPRASRVLDVLVLELCLLLVAGEVGLRVLARVRPAAILATPARGAVEFIAANRWKPGEMRHGFPINSSGHYDVDFTPRGAKPLVATIGDSFSYSAVPHHHHFTTVCERLLGVDVANFGVSAIGPPEYLALLTSEVLPLAPDLVVVDVFVGNDVGFEGRDRVADDSGLRSWLDRDRLMLAHVPVRFFKVLREKWARRGDAELARAETEAVTGRIDDPDEILRAFPWLADPLLEAPNSTESAFRDVELARAVEVCSQGEEFYAPFFDVMSEIARYAGPGKLAVLLIPDEFQVEDDVWRMVVTGLPDRELERDRPQRLIRAWLAERGIPCEDLLPRLRALPAYPDGRRHAYKLRDTHFNAIGNRVAGEGLADLVRVALRLPQ